jgi:AcrR family transcriptional regulator
MDGAAEKHSFWGVAPYQRPSAAEVQENQRRRLLLGITHAVAAKGYPDTTVADVLAAVRVSRRTFYELFADKESCFLAAYEVAHQALIEHIVQSQRGVKDAFRRIELAHRSYLEFAAGQPELVKAMLVGVLGAGPRAAARREQAHQEFADMHLGLHRLCRAQDPQLPEVPRLAFLALVAGTNKIVADRIDQGAATSLPELLPVVLYLAYSVYGLPVQARRAAAPLPKRARHK